MNIHNKIQSLLEEKGKILIAIDGRSGSGKSTLAKELAKNYKATIFHMDDYFLPPHLKTKERLEEAGGNVHYERVKSEIIDHIDDLQITHQIYNCQTNQLLEHTESNIKPIVIIEGVYSMHPSLIDFYDLCIVLDVPRQVQIDRIKQRSGETLLQRFIEEWIPLENKYLNAYDIHGKADILIKNY